MREVAVLRLVQLPFRCRCEVLEYDGPLNGFTIDIPEEIVIDWKMDFIKRMAAEKMAGSKVLIKRREVSITYDALSSYSAYRFARRNGRQLSRPRKAP